MQTVISRERGSWGPDGARRRAARGRQLAGAPPAASPGGLHRAAAEADAAGPRSSTAFP